MSEEEFRSRLTALVCEALDSDDVAPAEMVSDLVLSAASIAACHVDGSDWPTTVRIANAALGALSQQVVAAGAS